MATYQILYWQSIPSIVEASDGTDTVKVQLSERFQILIDAVAMRLGLSGTDEYLDQWAHGDDLERPGSPREVAHAVAAELESRFAEFRDRSLPPA
ncbi:MAG: virulence factor [Candidatus Rokubacteria bacterium]|nr:virulence factor [Candidatus Rokubacteria bacterium]